MKKAVVYARFSSSNQTEQSIEGQLRVCHNFAKQNGFSIINEYIDRAKTAQNDNRPFFQKMLSDSGKKNFEYVIVYAVDRFSRDDGDYGYDKKILRNNGVTLLSATEQLGINADGTENLGGILTEGLLVALAKYYSRELSKKVKRGQNESLVKGNFLGGHVQYGYKVIDKKIIIDSQKALIVKQMFEMYSKGHTAFSIAEELKSKSILNDSGKFFVPNTIINMLKNEKYIGKFKYGEKYFENYYPSIIDEKLFMNVQSKIKQNKRNPARLKAKELYLLSGKLYCGYCKSLMTGETGTSKNGTIHHYYKCFGKKKLNGCKKKNMRKDILEDLVIESTIKHILKTEVVEQITTEILKFQKEHRENSELKLLNTQLTQTKSYISNIVKAIKLGIFSETTQIELTTLEKQKKLLEEQIVQQEFLQDEVITKEHVEFWFEQFMTLDLKDKDTREYIVTYFINKIILFDDKLIIIYNHHGDSTTEIDIDDISKDLCSNLTLSPLPAKSKDFLQ